MPTDPRHIPMSPEHICEIMEEVFANGGAFSFVPIGTSMLPMLRERQDTVLLRSPRDVPIRKYDVVLYRRADGHVVLHRVMGRDAQGNYMLCGDRQTVLERNVRPEQILGVLCGFTRDGKKISTDNRLYRGYAVLWSKSRPIRLLLHKTRRRLARDMR